MVTLDTASKAETDTPTSGSLKPDGEVLLGRDIESLASLEPVIEHGVSTHRASFGFSPPSLETYARMVRLVSSTSGIVVHVGNKTFDGGATEGYVDMQRETLKQEVYALLTDAGTENWDGEGALALQQDTVGVAQELINHFPPYIGPPDVAATPHGDVDFDWVISRDVMLTLSVAPSREIAFAGLFNGARVNGCEPWAGALPHFVQCCFERLREAQSP